MINFISGHACVSDQRQHNFSLLINSSFFVFYWLEFQQQFVQVQSLAEMQDSLDIMRAEQENKKAIKNKEQNKSKQKELNGIKSTTQIIIEEHPQNLTIQQQQFQEHRQNNSSLLGVSKQQIQSLNKTPFFGDEPRKVKHYQQHVHQSQLLKKQSVENLEQQRQEKYQQKHIQLPSSQHKFQELEQNVLKDKSTQIVNRIFQKSVEGLIQFQNGFDEIQLSQAHIEQPKLEKEKEQEKEQEKQEKEQEKEQEKVKQKSILNAIFSKTFQALSQFQEKFDQIEIQKLKNEESDGKKSLKHIDEDNQFMTEQFGSNQRLEEVKKYVDDLKSETINNHLLNEAMKQEAAHHLIQKIEKVTSNSNHRILIATFDFVMQQKLHTPDNQQNNSKKQRVGSANVQKRMDSAQSQRLKSAISRKSSQNEQSFHLDLTVKTKGSKNPYKIGKLDSLTYSQQSDFGFHPNSPNKSRKAAHQHTDSNRSVLQRTDDLVDQSQKQPEFGQNNRGNLRKSYSQKVQIQQTYQNKEKRILSSKQNIQQFEVNQNQNEHDEQDSKRNREQQKQNKDEENNSYPYPYDNQNAQHRDNFFRAQDISQSQKTPKQSQEDKGAIQYQRFEQNDQQGKEGALEVNQQFVQQNYQKQQEQHKQLEQQHKRYSKPSKNQSIKRSLNDRPSQNKNKQKYRHHDSEEKDQDYQHTSVRDGTIIDRVQNFDADDQDGEEKQLAQSAHFAKKKNTQHLIRKRVQTQIGKKQKQPMKHDFSKKNIKRFNKIDLSKLEQQSQPSKSRAISQHNSQANIFATEISNYQKKILKIKEEKQSKKKKLQQQLAKINQQLQVLNLKQQQLSPNSKNNYASRVKISDNTEAQKKAQSLVKNLRSQKRNRNIAKIGQFKSVDKNINEYMEELTHLRSQNQQKMKQRKKIQILERMKQNQMRKMNEKKKIQQNQQFVLQLKGSGTTAIGKPQIQKIEVSKVSKRNVTKQKQIQEQQSAIDLKNLTPELNQKKAYLNKLRHFAAKKPQKPDAYEQLLN